MKNRKLPLWAEITLGASVGIAGIALAIAGGMLALLGVMAWKGREQDEFLGCVDEGLDDGDGEYPETTTA